MFKLPITFYVVGTLVVALLGGWGYTGLQLSSARTEAREAKEKYDQLERKLDKQKIDAAAELQQETNKVRNLEGQLATLRNDLDVKGKQNEQLAKNYEGRIADLIKRGDGRLRDPNAKPVAGCRSGGENAAGANTRPADPGPNDATQTGGVLSVQLTDLLRRTMREADEVNTAYAACKPWAEELYRRLTQLQQQQQSSTVPP